MISNNSNNVPYSITIKSNERISGTNSSFVSSPVDLGINDYDSVLFYQASIPRSFYNVPTNYNTFTLKEGVTYTTITLPIGSYNRINLQTKLQSVLNSSSPNLWIYSVSYPNTATNPDTFKYTITVSGNTSQPEFIFTDSMFRQIGFSQNSTNVFVANSLTSSSIIDLAYVGTAFIKSDICSNTDYLQELQGFGTAPILSYYYFNQQSPDLVYKQLNTVNFNSWSFTLVDIYDQVVDLNNVPWTFTIILFKRNDTFDIHKMELLLKNEERLFNIEREQKSLPIGTTEDNGGFIAKDFLNEVPLDFYTAKKEKN